MASSEDILASLAEGSTEYTTEDLQAALMLEMPPPEPDPFDMSAPDQPLPEAPATPAAPSIPSAPATYPGPGRFNPRDHGQWGAYRGMAAGATEGINRMPFVYGGGGGYGSLNGMTPDEIYARFYQGGGQPGTPQSASGGGGNPLASLLGGAFGMGTLGGLGGLGGLDVRGGGGQVSYPQPTQQPQSPMMTPDWLRGGKMP